MRNKTKIHRFYGHSKQGVASSLADAVRQAMTDAQPYHTDEVMLVIDGYAFDGKQYNSKVHLVIMNKDERLEHGERYRLAAEEIAESFIGADLQAAKFRVRAGTPASLEIMDLLEFLENVQEQLQHTYATHFHYTPDTSIYVNRNVLTAHGYTPSAAPHPHAPAAHLLKSRLGA